MISDCHISHVPQWNRDTAHESSAISQQQSPKKAIGGACLRRYALCRKSFFLDALLLSSGYFSKAIVIPYGPLRNVQDIIPGLYIGDTNRDEHPSDGNRCHTIRSKLH